MSTAKVRRLTVLLPVLSLLVSIGIVSHQYARKSSFTEQLKQANRTIAAEHKRAEGRAMQPADEPAEERAAPVENKSNSGDGRPAGA